MFLIILLSLFLLIIGGLLFTPISVDIDSETNQYQLAWGRILTFNFIPLKNDFLFRLKVVFWKKDWSIFELKTEKKEPKSKPDRKSKTSFKKAKTWMKVVGKSFKIRTFHLNLDTDNYITNAYLFPIFYFLNFRKGNWKINFEGKTELRLWAVNKPIWVLQKMIKYRNDLW